MSSVLANTRLFDHSADARDQIASVGQAKTQSTVAHVGVNANYKLTVGTLRFAHVSAGNIHSHGSSEAWITSGRPSPPTERMARSTSFNPKRWVVTSSSGKRFEANCASASSQAL